MRIEIADQVAVRSFRRSDAPSIARHADDREVWLNLRDAFPHPYQLEDAQQYIDRVLAADPELSFAIAVADEAVGSIGIRPGSDIFRRSVEIGYWIGSGFWGRGIVPKAVDALCNWTFRNFDFARIFAGVFAHNRASARVLEKAGFQFEGRARQAVTKDGKTFDDLVYARLREDGSDSEP